MLKRTLLLLLLSVVSLIKLQADDVTKVNGICFWTADGKCYTYTCADHPVITPKDGEWLVTVDGILQFSVSIESVVKTTFTEDPTGIVDQKASTAFSLTPSALTLEQLSAGDEVSIYTIDGKAIISRKASQEGRVSLDLTSLTKGIYVVKSGSLTFKFMKR